MSRSETFDAMMGMLLYIPAIAVGLFVIYFNYKIFVIVLSYQKKQEELFSILKAIGREIRDMNDSKKV